MSPGGVNKAIFTIIIAFCPNYSFNHKLLQNTFNALINSFIDTKVGISENFLPPSLASQLKKNLLTLFKSNQLQPAGTGNKNKVTHNKSVRSDMIYWLDRRHMNPYENEFFDLIDNFVSYLNSTCYTGITGYEFQYALYEKGSFYKKHLDQFRNIDNRKYSMIMYLNEDWQKADGGELCIYQAESRQNIAPENGKMVFFKSSELEHEVLLTHKARMSITGWLTVNSL